MKKKEVHTMLFQKNTKRRCELCIYASQIEEDTVQCAKKGIRPSDSKCLSFQYDPCKRKPSKAKAMDFSKYEEYDYSL